MTTNFLPYAKQSISQDDILEVSRALNSDMITRGPYVEAFEKMIADFCNARFAVAFNSGTTALIASCHAAKISPSDRFLTTPNTFIATITAGSLHGASPIFIDIDQTTGNIDLEQLAFNLNNPSSRGRTLVMPVHFAGIPVDMQALDQLIKNPNTIVIEDAAHAIGSRYPSGQKVGSCEFSQMTVFSFHPAKNMTTGEGGMVTTNDEELYHLLKRYRNNGIEREAKYLFGEETPWYYEVHDLTGGFNFTELQAALGLSQLKRLDQFIEKRRQLVAFYRQKLHSLPNIRMLTDKYDSHTAFHLCVVLIDFAAFGTDRTTVMNALKEKGIGTQVHYIPIYRHPYFLKQVDDLSAYFPQMEMFYQQALSLPLYYDLTFEEVDRVVGSLKEVLNP